MSDKELKFQYAPGCFSEFDGTQEELDELVGKIEQLFSGKTPEEIESMGEPVTEDFFERLPEEVQDKLLKAMEELDNPELSRKQLQ
jgi:hypothetical protein